MQRPLPQTRLPGPVPVKSFSGRELDGEEVEKRLRQQSRMKERGLLWWMASFVRAKEAMLIAMPGKRGVLSERVMGH